jgi:hypothetical protein
MSEVLLYLYRNLSYILIYCRKFRNYRQGVETTHNPINPRRELWLDVYFNTQLRTLLTPS